MERGTVKKDLIWNTAGSLLYALASLFLAFFVTRWLGLTAGGVFGIGFSTFGQQMFIVSYFGIRPFQITDAGGVYRFGTYRRMRLLTAGAAVLLAAVWQLWMMFSGTYRPDKALAVFLLALYKIIDGYADVYESECQRAGALWRGGQGLFFRTLCSMTAFAAAVLLYGGLLTAALAGVLAQLAGLLAFNIMPFWKMQKNGLAPGEEKQRGAANEAGRDANAERFAFGSEGVCGVLRAGGGTLRSLFGETWLLFLSVFLDFYVFSAAKYAIDLHLTDADSGIFNFLFMPTNFIYLAANFVIKPFMTRLAEAYEARDRAAFCEISGKLTRIVSALLVFAILGAALFGGLALSILEWMLGASYAGVLTAHRTVFVLIIAGGGFYALANLYYYILVTLRRQRAIFGVYLAAAMAALLATGRLVAAGGMFAAACCYMLWMLLLLCGFYGMTRRALPAAFSERSVEKQ